MKIDLFLIFKKRNVEIFFLLEINWNILFNVLLLLYGFDVMEIFMKYYIFWVF